MQMKILRNLWVAVGALALVSCGQQPAATEAVSVDKAAVVIENIMTRVSVRQFTNEPVAKADLETILKAGLQAPSAMNAQDWQLRIVTNQDMLNTLSGFMLQTEMGKGMAERLNGKNAFANAPAVAFVCAETGEKATAYNREDTALMSENMLLAIHALGLGATYQAAPARMINDSAEAKEFLKSQFGLPENAELINIIIIGHPAESPAVKDRDQSKRRIIE